MRINLFTTFYDEKDPTRWGELLQALEYNCLCPAIDRIFVLNESDYSWEGNKIQSIPVKSRPLYNDFFELINQYSRPDDINIIANTDIYFDRTISVLRYLRWHKTCVALSRWNVRESGKAVLFNRNDSQDVWIFRGPVKNVFGDFPLGVPFCDNRILYECQRAGYRVLNPSYSIRSFHLHGGIREEYDIAKLSVFVQGPYRYLFPHNLWCLPRMLWFRLGHGSLLGGYRYDLKKLNRWWLVRLVRKSLELVLGKQLPLIGYPPKNK